MASWSHSILHLKVSCCVGKEELLTSDINPSVVTRTFMLANVPQADSSLSNSTEKNLLKLLLQAARCDSIITGFFAKQSQFNNFFWDLKLYTLLDNLITIVTLAKHFLWLVHHDKARQYKKQQKFVGRGNVRSVTFTTSSSNYPVVCTHEDIVCHSIKFRFFFLNMALLWMCSSFGIGHECVCGWW